MVSDNYRYGPWHGGPDPLAPPYDIAKALDALGDDVLAGSSPGEALSSLLRRGTDGMRGLDDMMRRVRQRQREARSRGRLDGTLEQVRALLDKAIGQERATLFPDPSDDARMREAELDNVPSDPARAVRQLADYEWRSPEAAGTYEGIRGLAGREGADSPFRGNEPALGGPAPQDKPRGKGMLAELNNLLDADARGEDTSEAFSKFMADYGDFFPENPQSLEELV